MSEKTITPEIKNFSSLGLILLTLISIACYFLLAFFIVRTQTLALYSVFAVLFFIYAYILVLDPSSNQLKYLFIAALVFRVIFFLATPHLSDDYFRFIWDGQLSTHGTNPYNVMPSEFIHTSKGAFAGVGKRLFEGLNSRSYYTVYPPVMQGIFWVAVKLFPHSIKGNIVVMRVFIFLAECGTVFLLQRLLVLWGKDSKSVLVYAWNPLVITELTGNLHFEAIMIFLLLLAVYWLVNQKTVRSGMAFGLAVSVKLLPLMLLPALIRRIGWKRTFVYSVIAAAITILSFIPFEDRSLLQHIGSSIGLYFRRFEFNASLFYVIRWLGFQTKGYDIIRTAGIWLPILTFTSIVVYLWKERKPAKKNIFTVWMWIWTVYLAASTVVHPWYITPLVAFAVFSEYRFPVVWSGVAVLSYFAYRQIPYHESMLLVAMEYGVVLAVMLWEIIRNKNNKSKKIKRFGI